SGTISCDSGTLSGNATIDFGALFQVIANQTFTFNGTVTDNGTLGIGAGATATFNGPVAGSGTISSDQTGTVNYLLPSQGQVVLSGFYGNLFLNNVAKNVSGKTVNVANIFTVGTAANNFAGSTLVYNGPGAQNVALPYILGL